MRNKVYSRTFLNPKEGVALIEVRGRQGADWVDADVVITDCTRRIELDFSYGNPKSKREKLKKIALLITELQKLEQFMKEPHV